MATERRWQEFSDDAEAAGIKSVLSIPLAVGGESKAAMNIYAKSVHAFDGSDEAAAVIFARQAGIVLANREAFARSEEVTEQLREALKSREMIGEAKGILMERESLTQDQAFDRLRELSQKTNRKLREIAEEIVSGAESDAAN
jgi:GAF domain-containing protein